MDDLEKHLGHHFARRELLRQALTHSSFGGGASGAAPDNERLEFLGDSVLHFVVTRHLYEAVPEADEGVLSRIRHRVVSAGSLARVARDIGLEPHLRLGKSETSNAAGRPSILADSLEAVIGALFLDAGIETAADWILRHFAAIIDEATAAPDAANPKGRLQEILQQINTETPVYQILADRGPDHRKEFTSAVVWNGIELGRGTGTSKRIAETRAAEAALATESWRAKMPEPGN